MNVTSKKLVPNFPIVHATAGWGKYLRIFILLSCSECSFAPFASIIHSTMSSLEIEKQPLKGSRNDDEEDVHHEENKGCSTEGLVVFVLGLISGTFSALLCKMAYDTKSAGLDGIEKPFTKPIMMLTLMFVGMVPAMLFWWVQQHLLVAVDKREHVSWKTIGVLVVPSLCDLMCTLLLLVAQLYITASLWQMMRGSIIIITALLKRYALGHRLKQHMWLGVGFITLAMLLVASTSFFGPSAGGESKDPRIGIVLVLVGCIAQGVQCKCSFQKKMFNAIHLHRQSIHFSMSRTRLLIICFFPSLFVFPLLLTRRVRGEGDVCRQRSSPGRHRLRGHVGCRAQSVCRVSPGLPGPRGGQRLLRGPLRCAQDDGQQLPAAGELLDCDCGGGVLVLVFVLFLLLFLLLFLFICEGLLIYCFVDCGS